MKIKVISKLLHENGLPIHETEKSAGVDFSANLEQDVIIQPGSSVIIGTGLQAEIPDGYELQIRSRSGLAANKGLIVLNSPGTIDADYRGEIMVILMNHSTKGFKISNGDKIAQGVLNKFERIEFVETDVLTETDRGESGFGSTDKKSRSKNGKSIK